MITQSAQDAFEVFEQHNATLSFIRRMNLQYVSQRALAFMSPQCPMFDKAFATPATPVSVVVCVVADNVILHVPLLLGPGRTEGAGIWPLSGMGP